MQKVLSIRMVNKFLKILKRNLGSERRTPRVFQEAIETVGPKMNDSVVRRVLMRPPKD